MNQTINFRCVCIGTADGTFRIAIAHRDPGLPHWLDTAGHSEGGAIFRWLLPEGDRERPTFRVIKI